MLESVFQNLTAEEFKQAQLWYNHLQKDEQEGIRKTLQLINQTDFSKLPRRDSPLEKIAVIVAGSSVEGRDYSDIDLFIVPEKSVYSENLERCRPRTVVDDLLDERIPEGVFCGSSRDEKLIEEVREYSNKKPITIGTFHELRGFDQRRPDSNDDILEPPASEKMGAEQIIAYNREQGSKFLVLSRQYPLPN